MAVENAAVRAVTSSSPGARQQKLSSGHYHRLPDEEKKTSGGDDDGGEGFRREMRDLEEMFSKLNPMAREFVPPSLGGGGYGRVAATSSHAAVVAAATAGHFGYSANGFVMQQHVNSGVPSGNSFRRKKNGYSRGKRRMYGRTSMAQSDEVIRRTVYVSDIDHQVTEEQLAALFIACGQVVDCRICGDPNSALHFAFIEFTDEDGARVALSLSGTMLGYNPCEDEREMCARTIYCTNIDKKVTQADIRLFFESICGEVYRLRLLGDNRHSTRIAFVEFVMAESAIAALNCSGAIFGSLPIRVSPSKTPVRPPTYCQSMH